MNRFQSQVLYGVFVSVTGIFLLLLSYNPSRIIQYGVAAGMFLSSFFAFVTSNKSKGSEIPFKYNWLLGMGMFAYALAILIYASTFERFITVAMAFLLYFGVAEIILGFGLMDYKRKISMSVIVLRMITGFLMAVGSVIIIGLAYFDKNISLLVAGVLIFLSGMNSILFANAARKIASLKHLNHIS